MTPPPERKNVLGDPPGWSQAIVMFALLYVAIAVSFTTVTADALVVGGLATGLVTFALEKTRGTTSRVTILGGTGFAVVVAIVAAVLSG
ncbi:hypothetical protein DW322_09825 [Rhodococcus rhodnii]|nr:hypothetical protein [Rhodococcus rhodnii]TXG90465.1 hypothetical protein DW322_09825 [Rhodococcus rhodnii]